MIYEQTKFTSQHKYGCHVVTTYLYVHIYLYYQDNSSLKEESSTLTGKH